MNPEGLFLREGNLRPIWRFCLAVILVFLVHQATVLVTLEASHFLSGDAAAFACYFLFELAALLAVFKLLTRFLERKPLGVVGLAFHPAWVKELCAGFGIGGIMMLAVGGAEALLALAWFGRTSLAAGEELAYGGGLFLLLLLSATNEELVFRGYPFQRLVDSLGPAGAVAVSSVCFGLMHLGNPDHTWFSTINTMLVGIPLSLAYLRTRALWLPVGIHFAWNYIQGFILGLPVSGIQFPATLLNAQVHGGKWLTGSVYGPEGGIFCTLVVLGAAIFLFLSSRIRISGRMKELVYGPSPYATADEAVHIAPRPDSNEEGPS